jgi:hypothetical protein
MHNTGHLGLSGNHPFFLDRNQQTLQAMECYEKGVFANTDLGSLDLRFGNESLMIDLNLACRAAGSFNIEAFGFWICFGPPGATSFRQAGLHVGSDEESS